MIKLLGFCFQVTNSRLKMKKPLVIFHLSNSMGGPLFCHIRVTNVKLINEKESLNVTFLNVVKPLEIDTTP